MVLGVRYEPDWVCAMVSRGAGWCCSALVVLGLTGPVAARAQVDAPTSFDANIPYAHYYGTGTYRLGDQRVYALSLRARFPLGAFTPERVGFNIRASGMVAWQQIPVTDSLRATLPFFTIVPGMGLDIPIGRRVVLQPFLDAGVVRDVEFDTWLALGTVGTEVEWVFPWKRFEIGIEPTLGYSRTFSSDELARDELLAAYLMLDVRHGLGFRLAGEQADLGGYVLYSGFWGDTDLSGTVSTTVEIERQIEFGVSFGTNPRPKIWFLRLPRVSVGYRFGKELRGLRISFSDRRLRLPPR